MGITGKHADVEVRRLDDLAVAQKGDDVATTLLRAIVKGVAIAVKLLVGIRGNQVAIMKATPGVELRTPRDRKSATDTKDIQDGKK